MISVSVSSHPISYDHQRLSAACIIVALYTFLSPLAFSFVMRSSSRGALLGVLLAVAVILGMCSALSNLESASGYAYLRVVVVIVALGTAMVRGPLLC